MSTREELITQLKDRVGQVMHDGAHTTEELDWLRSARMAVERLEADSATQDDEVNGRALLERMG